MSITAYHIPNAVHPFKVPVPTEGLLFPPIKIPVSWTASINGERNIKVGVTTKHISISMEEFSEILEEPMGGDSAKRDKGLGKDIPAKSNLDLKHLICMMEDPSQYAPFIPV
jgi:hypothetical protein